MKDEYDFSGEMLWSMSELSEAMKLPSYKFMKISQNCSNDIKKIALHFDVTERVANLKGRMLGLWK